jgi:hypothetical protein
MGADFATSKKVVTLIREGVAAKLVDAMMRALGSCFQCLSKEGNWILMDLYTAT